MKCSINNEKKEIQEQQRRRDGDMQIDPLGDERKRFSQFWIMKNEGKRWDFHFSFAFSSLLGLCECCVKTWRIQKVFFNLITRPDFYRDHKTGMSDNFNEFIKLLNLVKYKISALNQVSYVIERFNLTGNLQTSLSQDSDTKSSQLSSSTVFLVFHYFPTSKHEKDVNL